MKPKVLITWPLKPKSLAKFDPEIDFVCIPGKADFYQETMDMIKDYDGLMVFGLKVDQALMDQGSKLKVISNFGVGYDKIDVDYAEKKGIVVSNTPISVTAPTAHLTMGLMLAVLRKISILDSKLKADLLESFDGPQIVGNSLIDKTLGIVGFGRIGQAVAVLAQAFGMRVIYHKRKRLDSAEESDLEVEYRSLQDLLRESDVVTLHLPLNDDTSSFINEKELALMKSTAYLINTARGGVVNEGALLHALQHKNIAGAGLDVFWKEPEIPEAYRSLDNVVLTPHIGTNTTKARKDMMIEVHSNISSFFRTGEVESRVV